MPYWLNRILTRPRAVFRALRKVGLRATLSLIRIRLGSSDRIYPVKVPQWPEPVLVRGGNSTDTTVLYELLVTGEYDVLKALDPPRTIIDGGANIGLTALTFLERYPAAQVISVEPFPETFEVCQKNLARFGSRAVAVQGAIWPHAGRVCLDPQGEDWANRVRAEEDGHGSTVEAFTMSSLIAAAGGTVDLFKLDVEGSEKEIFGYGSEEWLPHVRNVIIEVHGPDCKDRVFEALAPYDYELSNHDNVYFCKNLRARRTTVAADLAALESALTARDIVSSEAAEELVLPSGAAG